jgi:3-oxoacyl-[acyl-carrier protein] reductase
MTTPLDGATEGRVAIVTGGSRGVGRAMIARLAACGYAVVVNYLHDQHGAESTVETVLAGRGAAVAVRADVTDDLDVQRLFAETIVAFGRVDAVVHAVQGRILPTPVIDVDLDEFDAPCRINTRATLIVNREAARTLRDGGAIVNLASSTVGSAASRHGAIAVSTAAAVVLTRVLAIELRDRDITVNAVSVDVDEPCAPNRIADIVVHLLSAGGHGLTGQGIRPDAHLPTGR